MLSFLFPTGLDSNSISSATEFGPEQENKRERERPAQPKAQDSSQTLLDRLTQAKLDSKTKMSKHNDLSSGQSGNERLLMLLLLIKNGHALLSLYFLELIYFINIFHEESLECFESKVNSGFVL